MGVRMQIMNTYFINLPERTDKHWGQKIGLSLIGWNKSQIISFPGVDPHQYPDNADICEGMKTEGFNNFDVEWFTSGQLYSNWSHMRVLQEIVDTEQERTLVLEDDTFIYNGWTHYKLNQLINEIGGNDNVDLIYLDWQISDLEGIISLKSIISWMEDSQHSSVLKNVYAQGSRARLWTKKGAKRFLDTWKSTKNITSENLPVLIGCVLNDEMSKAKELFGLEHTNSLVNAVRENYGDDPPQFYILDPKGAIDISYKSILEKQSDK